MIETTKDRLARLPFKWPWADEVEHLRREVLSQKDYDPATLFVFGQIMVQALLELLKAVEGEFGERGQKVCVATLKQTGYQVASQCFEGVERPEDVSDSELASLLMTLINGVWYASPEEAGVNEDEQGFWCDILWCPVGKTFSRFDCRIHRYFGDGAFRAAMDKFGMAKFTTVLESLIPAGSNRCRFRWQVRQPDEPNIWAAHSRALEEKALRRAGGEAGQDRGSTSSVH